MSEIVELKKEIEAEIRSMMLSFYGYRETGRHKRVDNSYSVVGEYQERLERLVGKKEAFEFVFDCLNQEGKKTLLDIRREYNNNCEKTITTQHIAERAGLPISTVHSVEVGGHVYLEEVRKVLKAFNSLTGKDIKPEDISFVQKIIS